MARALVRRIARAMLGTLATSPLRAASTTSAQEAYLAGGRLPWSEGYSKFKNRLIDETLRSTEMMARFRHDTDLPPEYGVRLDERVIEYPWVIARLRPDGYVMDAGSTFNAPLILNAPQIAGRKLLIYTFETDWITLDSRISYMFGDLRNTLLKDAIFEAIVCISTLEHVGYGLDYKTYSMANPFPGADPASHLEAVREFRRLLKPGGQLLVTVPYGRYEDHGWLQQFDAAGISAIKETFAGTTAAESYYRYAADGWRRATPEECVEARYYDIHSASGFDPDYAAAARAVACLDLRKA